MMRNAEGVLIGDPILQVVAAEDGTEVRVRPNIGVSDGVGVKGSAAGEIMSVSLSRGEVLQITQPDEITGSPIESNKPVGVFGG